MTTPALWLGCQRIDLEECGSTNDEAARLARAGARHGTIVIANAQRAGRGREGRVWMSPPGLGLYLSAVLRPPLPLVDVPPMTLAIGIGVCDAVRLYAPTAALKWPNDVLIDGKKVGGVLVEAQSQGNRLESVIVGIGINLGGEVPAELADRATTLGIGSGDRERFLIHLLAHTERWLDRYVASGLAVIAPAWRDRMAANLRVRTEQLVGELAGLDGDGALLLRDTAGHLHRVRSGDVEVIRDTPGEPAAQAC
jgi:BirA family transcriptional regulator, biotin operon repressor / biotin---[acetyl-CoA-carboxylase] ligase